MLWATMESGPPPTVEGDARHRYGLVLAIALAAVVFLIVAPEAAWSRAIGLAFAGGLLLAAIATSRGNARLRASASAATIAATIAIVLAVAFKLTSQGVGTLLSAVLVIAALVQLVRGLIVLLRAGGVTIQTVAGALAVYLLLGIVFSFVITTMARLGHGFYFAQGTNGSQSQRVYFSFTTLTTTGFGDLSPAQRGGRAVAVLEMLTGQIYLVTVISLLVGNLRRRRESDEER